jgi:hypothetical protein
MRGFAGKTLRNHGRNKNVLTLVEKPSHINLEGGKISYED